MSAVPARFGPHMAALSRPDSRHQGLDAEDVERSPQIVDERRQAELGPDVVESLHQKCDIAQHGAQGSTAPARAGDSEGDG
jgi:hypothetical protein